MSRLYYSQDDEPMKAHIIWVNREFFGQFETKMFSLNIQPDICGNDGMLIDKFDFYATVKAMKIGDIFFPEACERVVMMVLENGS